VEKTSQKLQVTIDQHVPKILKSWFDGHSEKHVKKYFSVIGQRLLNNHECARNQKEENFSGLVKAENIFQRQNLEALCIQSLRPSL